MGARPSEFGALLVSALTYSLPFAQRDTPREHDGEDNTDLDEQQSLDDWKGDAQDLLVATAEQTGIDPPDAVLAEPYRLFSVYEELLGSVSVDDLDEDEFYMLGTQLVALIAQVLMVEHGAVWTVEDNPDSISSGRNVLVRTADSNPRPYRVDPFLLVKSELDADQPDFERVLEQARTMITWDHPFPENVTGTTP